MRTITAADVENRLSWRGVSDALAAGHRWPRASIADVCLGPPGRTLLSRAAFIEGFGYGVKSVTILQSNAERGLPSIQGIMTLFDADTGEPEAMLDCALVTKWKTAGDSILGARHLARPDSKRLLIVGAGVVAETLVGAYSELFPGLETIAIWNRTTAKAEHLARRLAADGVPCRAVLDLADAVGVADIVASATMASAPILHGAWVHPGTHVDLIGAFKADMREADDQLLAKASLFVDSRNTTLDHIGELAIPIRTAAIARDHVRGDFYDLDSGRFRRQTEDEITVFKNGGGAHLDLMVARHILQRLG